MNGFQSKVDHIEAFSFRSSPEDSQTSVLRQPLETAAHTQVSKMGCFVQIIVNNFF